MRQGELQRSEYSRRVAVVSGLGLFGALLVGRSRAGGGGNPPDCGTYSGGALNPDSACGSLVAPSGGPPGVKPDDDCGSTLILGGSGESIVSEDNSCALGIPGSTDVWADFDCGLLAEEQGRSGYWRDNDCGIPGVEDDSGMVDNDCGLRTESDMIHTDEDCPESQSDADCSLSGSDSSSQ